MDVEKRDRLMKVLNRIRTSLLLGDQHVHAVDVSREEALLVILTIADRVYRLELKEIK